MKKDNLIANFLITNFLEFPEFPNTEAGLRVQAGRIVVRLQGFLARFEDPIVRRTLLFPEGLGQTVVSGVAVFPLEQTAAQRAAGVRMMATAEDPRGLKAFVNDGRARYSGLEARVQAQIAPAWILDASASLVSARELDPVRPVRRLPPAQAMASLRHAPRKGRWWAEASVAAAATQRHFNPGDFDDERIGASRRRADIAAFFHSEVMAAWLTTRAAGLGISHVPVFRPTGETVSQIQDRVLPLGAQFRGVTVVNDQTRIPLYAATPGWTSINLHLGLQLSPAWTLHAGIQNLADANCRVHGSGVDAAGRSAFLGIRAEF